MGNRLLSSGLNKSTMQHKCCVQSIFDASIFSGNGGNIGAIALAIEWHDCLLLIGGLNGRGFVDNIGLKKIGPIGIAEDEKFAGIIAF